MINRFIYVALFVTAVGVVACAPGVRCEDDLKWKVTSPDGQYEALYSVRGCGATTRDTTWVRVIAAGKNAEKEEPVAVLEGELPKGSPYWLDSRNLVIDYGSARVVKLLGAYENVRIRYKSAGDGTAPRQ